MAFNFMHFTLTLTFKGRASFVWDTHKLGSFSYFGSVFSFVGVILNVLDLVSTTGWISLLPRVVLQKFFKRYKLLAGLDHNVELILGGGVVDLLEV